MKWSKKCSVTLLIKGKPMEVVSTTGFARILEKSTDTIRRYEREGIFPQAPIYLRGCRYYPVKFAKELKPIVDKIPMGKKMDLEVQNQILNLFLKEKERCQ